MKFRISFLFIISCLTPSLAAEPKLIPKPEVGAPSVAGDLHGTSSFQRIPSELASPWTTGARPWLLWGSFMTVGFLAVQDYDSRTQQRIAKDKPLGDWSEVADYAGRLIPNAIYAAGMYGTHWLTKDDAYEKHGLIMIKASAYSAGVSTILKVLVKEQRPNRGKDRTSFPSGHATTSFAFASVVSAEHGFWPYGLGATMLATLTAIGRLNDNMHHGHDVMAGATIGTAFGLGVSYINATFEKEELGVAVLPMIDNYSTGLKFVYLIR